jgi:hypothetical protein
MNRMENMFSKLEPEQSGEKNEKTDVASFLENLSSDNLEKINLSLNFINRDLEDLKKSENKKEVLAVLEKISQGDLRNLKPTYNIAKAELAVLLSSAKQTVNENIKKDAYLVEQENSEWPLKIKAQVKEMEKEEGNRRVKEYIYSLKTDEIMAVDQALNSIGETFISLVLAEDFLATIGSLSRIVKKGASKENLNRLRDVLNDNAYRQAA